MGINEKCIFLWTAYIDIHGWFITGWGRGRQLLLRFRIWLPWEAGPLRWQICREADSRRTGSKWHSPSRSHPCSCWGQAYSEVDRAPQHVVEGTLGFFQDGFEVVEGHHCLFLDIVGDEFSSFGVDADLSGEVHDPVVDFGGGVGSDGFGAEGGVEGLDEAGHDMI